MQMCCLAPEASASKSETILNIAMYVAGGVSVLLLIFLLLFIVTVRIGLTGMSVGYITLSKCNRGLIVLLILRVRWPNQQCQALKDNSWSVHQVKGQSHQTKPFTR